MTYYKLTKDHKIKKTNTMEIQHVFKYRPERDDVLVSTAFLSIDRGYVPGEPPILFETRIFGGKWNQDYQERCSTYEEAILMHERAVNEVNNEYGISIPQIDEERIPDFDPIEAIRE